VLYRLYETRTLRIRCMSAEQRVGMERVGSKRFGDREALLLPNHRGRAANTSMRHACRRIALDQQAA
jgi:hypothetical protein